MYLYHGTSTNFDVPSLSKCKPHRDFGRGFYLAPNYIDAMSMAIKNSEVGYVKTYEMKDTDELSILELDGYSDDWLNFVVASRLGVTSVYDLVIGNMAGGGKNLKSKFSKLRNTHVSVELAAELMKNELTKSNLGVQYALLTTKSLSRLKLISTEQIEKE